MRFLPSRFGIRDCLIVKCAALVTVSSLTVIFLFHGPMVVVFSAVRILGVSLPLQANASTLQPSSGYLSPG